MLRKVEWPGIATAVGIVLILALIIVASRDEFHLKDWQPLMAAMIALGGGSLAYKGAMAKVDADRDRDRRELERKKLGLFFRLGFSLNQILVDATKARAKNQTKSYQKPGEYMFAELLIAPPPEIGEAWSFLDLLPRKAIPEIHVIRVTLQDIAQMIEAAPPGTKFQSATFGNPLLKAYFDALDVLAGACQRSMQELNAAIDRVRADE